nr:acyltransferase [Paenibacillus sp. PL91]MBC9204659.1 acyltransferase [Paenibacillus sp. PL91]
MTLNPVIWSLIHEMRVSLIFPFLMWVLHRGNFKKNLSFILGIPIIFFITYYICLKIFSYDITVFSGGYSSFILTPHYVAFFMLGGLLAKYQKKISEIYKKINVTYKISLVVLALIMYMYNWLVLPNNSTLHLFIFNDWAIATGCVIFITLGLNSKLVKVFLLLKLVNYVGKISYSLYLYHIPVILGSLYFLHGLMPVRLILFVSFAFSFIVSAIMYHMVELPSVNLGKRFTRSKQQNQMNHDSKTAIS